MESTKRKWLLTLVVGLILLAIPVVHFVFGGSWQIRRDEPRDAWGEPIIFGVIEDMDIQADPGGERGTILVVEGTDKIIFQVTEGETWIYEEYPDGSLQHLHPSQLTTGDRVKVWATGALMESYPMQGTALRIVIPHVR